ncbi:MAG: hypothetical protein GC189_07235 [Alphaproteobacteria bacterium]|nr:hypothetical protein [Alphaproteobacteria bacterium]
MGRARTWHTHAYDVIEEAFTEPPAARRRRLNKAAKDGKKAQVVDRSGSAAHLEHSAKQLKSANAEARVLRVPHWDMRKAEEAMRKAGVNGIVSNLCGASRKQVRGL